MKEIKTMRGLASAIAKIEGKRSQARIGDIREILSILCDLIVETEKPYLQSPIIRILEANGKRRANSQLRKK